MTGTAQHHTPVVGVLGGVGAGKSTVARLLAAHGARVVDADRIGHRVLEEPDVKDRLVEEFGGDILDEHGEVSRPALGRAAFGGAESRAQDLNSIVHPPIIRRVNREVHTHKDDPACPLVVLDAALLLEVGLDEPLCDALLYVHAPRPLRRRRATDRGMQPEQFDSREQAQLAPETKESKADFIIHNDGSTEELARQVAQLWPRLLSLPRRAGE
jgi:dephospho-CoA kinase